MLTLPNAEPPAPSFLPSLAGDADPMVHHILSPLAITVPSPSVTCPSGTV